MNKDVQAANQKLVGTLESLIKTYRVLLDQVRREKDHLIQIDLEELNAINKEKGLLLNKIQAMENTRILQAKDLAVMLNVTEEPIRLLELANRMDGAEGEKLRSLHSTLDLILHRVHGLNKENALLAENALQCASGVIEDIRNDIDSKAKSTYERKGRMQGKSTEQAGNFVRKQV